MARSSPAKVPLALKRRIAVLTAAIEGIVETVETVETAANAGATATAGVGVTAAIVAAATAGSAATGAAEVSAATGQIVVTGATGQIVVTTVPGRTGLRAPRRRSATAHKRNRLNRPDHILDGLQRAGGTRLAFS